MNSLLVYCAPWSVLQIAGIPYSRIASFMHSIQKPVSIVLDNLYGEDLPAVIVDYGSKVDHSSRQLNVGYVRTSDLVDIAQGSVL